jgi:hypothetical protein
MFGSAKKREDEPASIPADGEPSRPTLRGCAPKYAALAAKWHELQIRQAEIHRELHDGQQHEMFSQTERHDANGERVIESRPVGKLSLAARLRERTSRGFDPGPGPTRPEPPTDFPEAVRAKLGDVVEFPKPPAPVVDEDRERARRLTAEWEAIEAAKTALVPQMQRALIDGSRVFCQALLPEYRRVVGELVETMTSFGDAWLAHQRWVRDVQLEGADISSLRIMFAVADEALLPLVAALEWAIQCGLCGPEKMPAAWRKWKRGTLDTAPLHMGRISR